MKRNYQRRKTLVTSYLTFLSSSSFSFLTAFGGNPRLAMPLIVFDSILGLALEALIAVHVKKH